MEQPLQNKVNILVVDDRADNILAAETVLSVLDQNIITANSGPEALKQLLKYDFAVILLDVMMPGMNGYETAEIIRQREKSQYIPIIFLTAMARDQQYTFKGYAAGAVDYIYKPIAPEILLAKVKIFIDLYRINQQSKLQQAELKRINEQLLNEIEERKRIEKLERIAQVASKSYNTIMISDKEGKTEWVNEGFTMLTGYKPEEIIGTKGELVRKDSATYLKAIRSVCISKEVVSYEDKHYSKDGKEFHILVTHTPVFDDVGNIDKIITVETDISKQKLTEEKLIEANKAAQQAVKAKQQFLANMSHEIRTPMNAIIGFTKVLLKTSLNKKQKEYINAIKLSGDALIVLINDILDLAKVDAGKVVFEHIPFKPSVSVSAMLHLFETKIQEKNLELVKEYDPAIPEVLVGDPVRLHQIILNLVSNAIKFTASGKITISVKLLEEDEKKVRLEFSVTDTGIGIPEDQLDNIFEIFQQASSNTSRIYGGTGLGLAIVKQLVEAQNGSVSVKSTLHKGSSFSFILQFSKTDATVETEPKEFQEPILKSGHIRILVVEDIVLNQLLMKTLLDESGFEHDIAENGKAAIEKLGRKKYDIILMDLQMPEMDGFQTTTYIRETLKSDIPIIALTADVTKEDVLKCVTVGMNDYISKPVDENLLNSKIIRLVKKQSHHQQPTQVEEKKPIELNNKDLEQIIDLDYLRQHTKGNSALMQKMMSLYLQQTPALLNTMKESIETQNWEALRTAVHKLIPSFWMVGINAEFGNMAKTMQEHLIKKEKLDKMPVLFSTIENICKKACKEIEKELNMMNGK